MSTMVSVDGRIGKPEEARVSVFDHGFLFGDSVYEVVRTRRGRLFLFTPHAERLRRSAARIHLELPFTDLELRAEVERTVAAAGNEESYVRIVVTRGVGEIELLPDTCAHPLLIVVAKPFARPPEHLYTEGTHLAIVDRLRNSREALDPAAKTGNYLNNVLAIVEARARGAEDAVLLNAEGHLTEATTANLFLVRDGVVRTPALDDGLLDGITRTYILDLLTKDGVPCEEGSLCADDLRAADEAFLSSTTRDVLPVGKVDGGPIGDGVPGPVTRRLIEHFAGIRRGNGFR